VYNVAVFISHSWSYSEHYQKLREWIFESDWNLNGTPIYFNDNSVPSSDPIHNAQNASQLKYAIFERINKSNIVVIPTGMYANYSNWIQKEIDGANQYKKPILAVNPWAQEKKSSIVTEAASDVVGWAKDSVVQGVWRLYNRI